VVSKAKLFTQLDDLESILETNTLAHLHLAIITNNELVFCAADFITSRELRNKVDKETESLIILGRQVLALQEKLGECSKGSIAERICWYCREWSHPNTRLSGIQLAQHFIDEIENT
jgi:acyl carrier protein phosphodiesterase